MLNKIIIFTALLALDISILVTSETKGLKISNFRAYENVQITGGLIHFVPTVDKFKCILNCTSKTSCQGFSYDGGSCYQMDMSGATSLTFASDKVNTRIRRNVLLQNLNFDPVSLYMEYTLTLSNKLSVGDMVYLKAILLMHKDVAIEIYDKPDKGNVTYQMRARCSPASCDHRYVTIDNKYNGYWNDSGYHVPSYTLQLNEVFEVHVLITSNGIMTYLNGVFLFTLNTGLSALTANYVYFYGNMNVLEFSL